MADEIAMGSIDDDHLTASASEHEAEAEKEAEDDADNNQSSNDDLHAEKDDTEKDITTAEKPEEAVEKEAVEKESVAKTAAEPSTPAQSTGKKSTAKMPSRDASHPPSTPSQPTSSRQSQVKRPAKEDDLASVLLKSFDPEVQAARDERLSTERFMRMQFFQLNERLKRSEDDLKEANATIKRHERKISKLEVENMNLKLMAHVEERLASGSGRGKKRKAVAVVSSDEEEDQE
jgi:outer membrane biosynthesis protein TonB